MYDSFGVGSNILGFCGVQDSSSVDNFTINNLILDIPSEAYIQDSIITNQTLKLHVSENSEDNFIQTRDIPFYPSLFFSSPLSYRSSDTSDDYLEFCVYEPYLDYLEIDSIYFKVNSNEGIPLNIND